MAIVLDGSSAAGSLNLGTNGTISNLAVGGLPDGSVDRDTLATNAKRIWGSTVLTTSGTDHVLLSSIPADCNRFGWGILEISVGTDGDFGVQMSTSGGYVTSNYHSAQSWLRTGSSGTNDISDAFISCTPPSSDWGAGYKFTGNFEANRIKDYLWTFTGQVRGDESNEHTVWASGFVNISGQLTAIRLHSEQTLDNGAIRAWYEIGGS